MFLHFTHVSSRKKYTAPTSTTDLQCWVEGQCEGPNLDHATLTSESECLEACKKQEECAWFSYDQANGACILFTECDKLDTDDCEACWSGQRQCGNRKGLVVSCYAVVSGYYFTLLSDYTKILVIGGYSDELGGIYLDTVEVIDLSSDTSNCAPVANYPIPIGFGVGAIINGRPRVCGGDSPATDSCYQYLYETNQWEEVDSLQEVRTQAASSMVNSATWFITGSNDGSDPPSDTTEVWSSEGEFVGFGPDLPLPLRGQCQITVNSSYVLILGGNDGTAATTNFFMLDWREAEWREPLPDLQSATDKDVCGLIENSENGQEIVVMGDAATCHIYNFRNNSWRPGPLFEGPDSTLSESSATVQLNKNFVFLGGYLGNALTTDSIYGFDQENYRWVQKAATLSSTKRGAIAIAVPDDLVDCS